MVVTLVLSIVGAGCGGTRSGRRRRWGRIVRGGSLRSGSRWRRSVRSRCLRGLSIVILDGLHLGHRDGMRNFIVADQSYFRWRGGCDHSSDCCAIAHEYRCMWSRRSGFIIARRQEHERADRCAYENDLPLGSWLGRRCSENCVIHSSLQKVTRFVVKTTVGKSYSKPQNEVAVFRQRLSVIAAPIVSVGTRRSVICCPFPFAV